MICSAVVFLATLAVPARADDDAKKALAPWQGEWKWVSETKEGREISKENLAKRQATVEGDKLMMTWDGKVSPTRVITLDPSATPMTFDWRDPKDTSKRGLIRGIYKFEKDTLVLSYALESGDRPKNFTPDKNNVVTVLEKVKK